MPAPTPAPPSGSITIGRPIIVTSARREFVLGGLATAAMWDFIGGFGADKAQAQTQTQDRAERAGQAWLEAYRRVIGDAKPTDGQIKLELPEIAENGNTVPFTATAESPMTQLDYVKSMYVFSTANPVPVIATFHFTPQSGRAGVSSRMRLATTQDVVILAAHATGRFVMHKREIKVIIGGCGG